MEPSQKYEEIISTINLDEIHHAVTKKSCLGAPEELNYAVMIISIVVRYVERVLIINNLNKLFIMTLLLSWIVASLCAIRLLKGGHERFPQLHIRHQTMDAGYDYEPIYEQVHRIGQQFVIAYNKRNEREPIGFDECSAPTCFREHSYRYDGFDAKYETLKYTKPKEYNECPLANEGTCQKVYKVKITTDLRKYTAPAQGSLVWKNISKCRTAVEHVNAYLKKWFQLKNVGYCTGQRTKVRFDLVTLVWNASKLAANRINVQLNQLQTA